MCLWTRDKITAARRSSLILLLLLWRGPLQAQNPEASVLGLVLDTAGRPVSGAKVAATRSETGFSSSTTTDSQGRYYFGSLPLGLYTLKVEMAGYQGLEKQGIELAVGARDEENFTLALRSAPPKEAALGELFRIVPPAPSLPVDTIASSVSVVVDENKILQLPPSLDTLVTFDDAIRPISDRIQQSDLTLGTLNGDPTIEQCPVVWLQRVSNEHKRVR